MTTHVDEALGAYGTGALSTMDKNWKTYQAGLMFSLFTFASGFLLVSMNTVVMSPDVWGAAIYAIPADGWAVTILAASTSSLYGIYKNGRSRWSPLWRVGGYFTHLLVFLSFSIMASMAGFGYVVSLMATTMMVSHMTVFIYINIGDVVRSCRGD